jgi:hypothetical protein
LGAGREEASEARYGGAYDVQCGGDDGECDDSDRAMLSSDVRVGGAVRCALLRVSTRIDGIASMGSTAGAGDVISIL